MALLPSPPRLYVLETKENDKAAVETQEMGKEGAGQVTKSRAKGDHH